MKELDLSVQEIRDLMDAFTRNGLGGLKLQQGEFRLELQGRKLEQVPAQASPCEGRDGLQEASGPAETAPPEPCGNIVSSPIVGTFYAAPGPGKAPYVSVGSKVCKGDVLFVIESMKLMNEVTSELDGTVTEIHVENAQGVEYGQPILTIA